MILFDIINDILKDLMRQWQNKIKELASQAICTINKLINKSQFKWNICNVYIDQSEGSMALIRPPFLFLFFVSV